MESRKSIPTRDQIAKEDTWATEDLFASDELWEQSLKTLQEDQKLLASYAGRLGESGKVLCEYLINMERVDAKEGLLGNYIMR